MGVHLQFPAARSVQSANFVRENAGVFHPDRRMPVHDLLYTVRGRREIIEDDRRYAIGPGDVLFLAAGRHHWAERPSPTKQYVMYIHFSRNDGDRAADGVLAGGIYLPTHISTGGNIIIRKLFEEMIYLSWSSRPLKRMKADVLLLELLIELASLAASSANAIAQPIEYVIERIERAPEKNESLDAIADRVGLNRKTLTRRFRAVTGQSVNAYRMRVKISNALSLLTVSPDTPVRDIAERLGFYDEYHFSKAFKAMTGKSPTAHRAELSGAAGDRPSVGQRKRRDRKLH